MQTTHDTPVGASWSVRDLIRAADVTERTVRRWIEIGRVDVVRDEAGRIWISDSSVRRLLVER